MHEFAQGSRAAFNEQVHVIGDQAIGVDFELIFRPVVLQTIKVGFVVVIAAKRPSLLIAAHNEAAAILMQVNAMRATAQYPRRIKL